MLSPSDPKGKVPIGANALKPAPVTKKEDPCIIKREDFEICMKIRSIDDSCFHVLDEYLKCAANDSKQRVRGVPGVY
jgi:hypothetical protein